jgi:3-oxoacyl-[acyl-carrier-protein] synthase II
MNAEVVGMGVVTPLGSNLASTWSALRAGVGAIGPIRRFDVEGWPVGVAAEGPLPAGSVGLDGAALGRSWLLQALDEALSSCDPSRVDPRRIGVYAGAEAARPGLDEVVAGLDLHAAPRERAFELAPWAPAREVAARLGSRGPCGTWSTACTSSGQAVGEALLALRRGEVDVAVAVGVDVLVHPLMVLGFARLGALAPAVSPPDETCRPFDVERGGFTLGEGAGVIILSKEGLGIGSHLGKILGYGCTSNAWRITDAPPDGRGAAEAMFGALQHGGKTPEDVVLVHAHATGTRQNDAGESRAIERVLGSHPLVWGSKGALGHLVAACGVVGTQLALLALRDRACPRTRNLRRPDPDSALRHALEGLNPLPPGLALVNAFGFGGANASLLVGA